MGAPRAHTPSRGGQCAAAGMRIPTTRWQPTTTVSTRRAEGKACTERMTVTAFSSEPRSVRLSPAAGARGGGPSRLQS
eukprot:870929-Rhodomonas_salina.2